MSTVLLSKDVLMLSNKLMSVSFAVKDILISIRRRIEEGSSKKLVDI